LQSHDRGSTVTLCECVCRVCVSVQFGSFCGVEIFYFKVANRRDILNTTLMTRTTAHEQKLTNGASKHKHHI